MDRLWREHEFKEQYDAVVIGGGAPALATAYYLTQHGVRHVALLTPGSIGPATGLPEYAIVDSIFLRPEERDFYHLSQKICSRLAEQLEWNIFYSQRGSLILAHDDSEIEGLHRLALAGRDIGADAHVIYPATIQERTPNLNLSDDCRFPVRGALTNRQGAVMRRDAAIWGYARAADRAGAQIHQQVELTGIEVSDKRIVGIKTTRGPVRAKVVVIADLGLSRQISELCASNLIIDQHTLTGFVTEPLQPFVDPAIISLKHNLQCVQNEQGELIVEAINGQMHALGNADSLERGAADLLALFPFLAHVNVCARWKRVCESTLDHLPIVGNVSGIQGLFVNLAWGSHDMAAAPAAGLLLAECIACGKTPELLRPFSLDRFEERRAQMQRHVQ